MQYITTDNLKVVGNSVKTYIDNKFQNFSNDVYYTSLKQKTDYLYEIIFDKIPEYKEIPGEYPDGGCSSFVRGGKLYRSYDYDYDTTAEFIVKTPMYEGTGYIKDIKNHELTRDLLEQLPYHVVDRSKQTWYYDLLSYSL